MLLITFVASIIAAALNATSAIMQRLATHTPDAKRLFGHRFFYEMIKSRIYIFGFVLQTIAFLAQAVALKYGPLIIVEPLLTCDLIFLILLIHYRLHIHVKFRDWLSTAAIIIGLGGLFIATHPRGGNLNYKPLPWIIVVSILGPLIIILALAIRQISSSRIRAIMAAIAAAISFALNAAFIKLSFNLLNKFGFTILMTRWPIYALIITGIISIYLMVNAYGAGPLAISQTVIEIIEPAIAVGIGIFIFGETYSTSPISLFFGSICVIILIFGIISLATSPRLLLAGEQGA